MEARTNLPNEPDAWIDFSGLDLPNSSTLRSRQSTTLEILALLLLQGTFIYSETARSIISYTLSDQRIYATCKTLRLRTAWPSPNSYLWHWLDAVTDDEQGLRHDIESIIRKQREQVPVKPTVFVKFLGKRRGIGSRQGDGDDAFQS